MDLHSLYFVTAPILIVLVIGIAVLRAVRRSRRSHKRALTQRLDELTRLRDEGKINEEEYARARVSALECS